MGSDSRASGHRDLRRAAADYQRRNAGEHGGEASFGSTSINQAKIP
jgi:hypothetical protein